MSYDHLMATFDGRKTINGKIVQRLIQILIRN